MTELMLALVYATGFVVGFATAFFVDVIFLGRWQR